MDLKPPGAFFNVSPSYTLMRIVARITSYNVCYTKLLRIAPGKLLFKNLIRRIQRVKAFLIHTEIDFKFVVSSHGVITSYSIHYTKLYDSLHLEMERFDDGLFELTDRVRRVHRVAAYVIRARKMGDQVGDLERISSYNFV